MTEVPCRTQNSTIWSSTRRVPHTSLQPGWVWVMAAVTRVGSEGAWPWLTPVPGSAPHASWQLQDGATIVNFMGHLHTGNQKTSKLPYLYAYCKLVENNMLDSCTKRMPPCATVDSTNTIHATSSDNPLRQRLTPTSNDDVVPLTAGGNRYTGRGSAHANNAATTAELARTIGLLTKEDRPAVRVRLKVSPVKGSGTDVLDLIAEKLERAETMNPMARQVAYRSLVRRCQAAGYNPRLELPPAVYESCPDLVPPEDNTLPLSAAPHSVSFLGSTPPSSGMGSFLHGSQ